MRELGPAVSASAHAVFLAALLFLTGCLNQRSQEAPAQRSAGNAKAEAASHATSVRLPLTEHSSGVASKHNLVPAGTKSLLVTGRALGFGEYVWNDDGIPPGDLIVWIDLERQLGSVFRGGHEIGTSVILYGDDDHATPTGRLAILNKDRHYHSRAYNAPMPYAMFVTADGVAIHGSQMASGRATHGCVGLPEDFARVLFSHVKIGDIVTIVRSSGWPKPDLLEQPLSS